MLAVAKGRSDARSDRIGRSGSMRSVVVAESKNASARNAGVAGNNSASVRSADAGAIESTSTRSADGVENKSASVRSADAEGNESTSTRSADGVAKMDGGRKEGIERNVTSIGIAAGESMSGVTAIVEKNGGLKIGDPAEP
jgi:hypothetical protein